jgi:glycosyltransferase involved in cell wall biosynthesis
MRVCMITSSFPTSVEGTHGTFVFQMARQVARLPGYEVTVLAPDTSTAPMRHQLDGVTVKRFQYFYPRRSSFLCEGAGIPANISSPLGKLQLMTYCITSSLAALREKHVDVVHAHWPIPNALGPLIRSRASSLPYVTTVYGAEVYLAKRYHLGALLRLLVDSSAKSIAISKATHLACLGCGAPEQKLDIIPLGVDTSTFRPIRLARSDHAPLRIISVGRLVERKGFEYLIEAVAILATEGHRLKLEIAGAGPSESTLRQQIGDLGAERYVKLLGNKSPTELISLYNEADIFVLPPIVDSKGDTEGLGVVYLEAMACGLPVIGTRVGGVPDVVEHEYNGLLVPEKDAQALARAILDLVADDSKRERLALNSLRLARQKYDWQHIAKRYAAVYESVC